MSDSTELRKQQYERFQELFALGRQRYLDAGGNPRCRPSGRQDDDYLTVSERQEFFALGRQLSGFYVKDGYAYCQGRSWKLPDKKHWKYEQPESVSKGFEIGIDRACVTVIDHAKSITILPKSSDDDCAR